MNRRFSSWSRFVWVLTCLIVACSILGCGKGSPSSIKGQVTLDGKAVQNGDLVLRPMKGTEGPPVATKITAGKYEIARDKGLMAGNYLVLITATEKNAQVIPDKYNVGSSLTVDIAPGANDKDFALEPGTVTAPPMIKEEGLPPALPQ